MVGILYGWNTVLEEYWEETYRGGIPYGGIPYGSNSVSEESSLGGILLGGILWKDPCGEEIHDYLEKIYVLRYIYQSILE